MASKHLRPYLQSFPALKLSSLQALYLAS